MPDSPAPSDRPSTQCTATTNAGIPCRAPRVEGGTTCRLHSMTPEQRSQAAAQAAARSASVRAERVEVRAAAVEQARLGLQARLAQELEAEAEALTARLRALALSEDDGTALQGIKLWLERVHGRAVQPTADVTESSNPVVDAFAAMSPDERRALLGLAPPLPEDEHPASAQG